MGLLKTFARLASPRSQRSAKPSRRKPRRQNRRGQYELMEPRRLLAADIHVGLVYFEDASGEDEIADRFELTFTGGAEGTQLTELIIDTDKEGNGLTIGDVFFDTDAGGLGAFQAAAFAVIEQDGIGSVEVDVDDGGTQLVLRFDGFEASDRLVFSIDVDEQGFLGPNAVAEGNEVEGSILTATFRAPHFFDATGADIFIDAYDAKLNALGLELPPDDFVPPGDTPRPVHTAGALFALDQVPLPITISGTVFEDFDLDNTQDPGDPGISGVTIELWQFDGSTYAATGITTTTDADGHYEFDDVLPGQYRLVETQPAGLFSVGATAGTVDGATRGVVTSVDVISGVSLLGGEDSIRNDFAEARPATLSGHVYHDADDDGVRDAGETGIGGVTIEIQRIPDSGPLPGVITVTTAADGSWSATGLQPGKYLVREIQPDGFLDGQDSAGSAGGTAHNPGDLIDGIFLGSGQAGINYDFGELLPGSISGLVHADLDGDCILDPEEQPLEGVTVYLLDASGERIDSTTTDAGGRYEFNGLVPGTYGVEEIQPEGFFQGGTKVGTAGGNVEAQDLITGIVLTSGQEALDYNFCEHPPASVWGHVYADDNNDGVRDSGEEGIGGVTLTLLDAAGVSTGITTVTAADGSYHFDGLEPGTYGVAETQPNGFFDGIDTPGTAGGVAENPGDRITEIALAPGVAAMDYNFGELRPASISGYVYADDDNDGVFDSNESGIGGVTLTLLDAAGISTGITTVTAADGSYEFSGLEPGVYGVAEAQPAGFLDGIDAAGSAGGAAENPGDRITGAVLTAGLAAVDYNFGELVPASISGHVHADLDGDCILDPDEQPLAGVTVHLLNANGERIASTTTAADGSYEFDNLLPGTYGVEEVQPDGYFQGGQVVGSAGGSVADDDVIVDIVLATGTIAVDYNFCEHPPATIAGHVFQDGPTITLQPGEVFDSGRVDEIRDGMRKEGDTPIDGVVLQLGDFAGQPILGADGQPITTVTDANGFYEFTGLRPGVYTVLQDHPDGYIDGIDTPGTTGGIAVNPRTEISPELLTVPHNFDAIARIPVLPGQTSLENNFSEVLVTQLPPPSPPPPPEPPLFFFTPGPDVPAPTGANLNAAGPLVAGPTFALPPIIVPPDIIRGSGSHVNENYTWHLSVIDAGQPRDATSEDEGFVYRAGARMGAAAFARGDLGQSQWLLASAELEGADPVTFGMEGGIPVVGDFNGDGIADVGVYFEGQWFLDMNGNGVWDDEDFWAQLGSESDVPVTGDWDGDGKTDIGIYGPEWPGDTRAIAAEPGLPNPENEPSGAHKNLPPKPHEATMGYRRMRLTAHSPIKTDLIDHVFHYGSVGDIPITGDFNGDGTDSIGVFRGGLWLLDANGDGRWEPGDKSFRMGRPGDLPLVGDFNGDGVDELGVYRDGTWHIDTDGNRILDAHDQVFEYGQPGDIPVVGDWNGDGIEQPGVYRDGEVVEPTEQVEP